jgi:protoheme IX farnesyltransferase
MCGYAVAPGALSLSQLAFTTIGTALCASSANTLNQWMESPFDAQMQRTRSRPIVIGKVTGPLAFASGLVQGAIGSGILCILVSHASAAIGLSNIILYAFVYTPLKRRSEWNTWIGALVGGLPVLLGWSAATGSVSLGGIALASLVYAWQFPHFNALAFRLRHEYARAGYRMLAVTNVEKNGLVSLRNSLLMFPLCAACSYLGVVTPWFLLSSSAVNLPLLWLSYRFYSNANDVFARQLFLFSLIHLPLLLVLLMIHKTDSEED